MNIILVRHGETAWNKEVIFRGRIDIPLNNTGFAQADRVAHKLMHFKIIEVITSPLMSDRRGFNRYFLWQMGGNAFKRRGTTISI
jgi:broad specificity phosphatase PhoE